MICSEREIEKNSINFSKKQKGDFIYEEAI